MLLIKMSTELKLGVEDGNMTLAAMVPVASPVVSNGTGVVYARHLPGEAMRSDAMLA